MTVTTPPRRPDVDGLPHAEPEALVEEARRRARRRRQRNIAAVVVVGLGGLWLWSLVARDARAPTIASLTQQANAAGPRAGLPEQLSFTANGGITLVRRDGTSVRIAKGRNELLPDGSLTRSYALSGVQWSPDGSKLLAFRQSGSPALVLVGEDGKVGPKIASGASIGRWSPDGSRIAFVRGVPGAADALFVASSDGHAVEEVAPSVQISSGSYSWSPDGARLAYAGRRDAGLFVVDSHGASAPRRITTDSGIGSKGIAEAQWSPDGTVIAFRTEDAVYTVRPDGTGQRRVFDTYAYGLAWSPGGSLLGFMSSANPKRVGGVFVVRPNGSRLRQVAAATYSLRGPGFWPSFSWSSDGSRLAYVSGKGNTVSTVRPDGTGATQVGTQQARGLQADWYPWWPIWRPAHHG